MAGLSPKEPTKVTARLKLTPALKSGLLDRYNMNGAWSGCEVGDAFAKLRSDRVEDQLDRECAACSFCLRRRLLPATGRSGGLASCVAGMRERSLSHVGVHAALPNQVEALPV